MTDGEDDGFEERPTPPGSQPAVRPPSDSDKVRHYKTHPRGTPVVQSADDRALQHRRAPLQLVADAEPEEVTSPISLFEVDRPRARRARPSDSVARVAAELRARGTDPYVAMATLAVELTDRTHEDRTGRRELDRRLSEFLSVQPGSARFTELEYQLDQLARDVDELRRPAAFDELAKSVTELKTGMTELAPVRKGLRWLQASVVLIVIGIGGWLYARGGKETAIDMRIQALEKIADKLVDRLERERREPKDPHP